MCDACFVGIGGCEKSTSESEPGTLRRSPDDPEYRRSVCDLDRGGSSIGDGPWCDDRPEGDEMSETREGASVDSCEKADGDGKGDSM